MANDAPSSPPLPNRSTSEWFLVRLASGIEVWVTADALVRVDRPFTVVNHETRP